MRHIIIHIVCGFHIQLEVNILSGKIEKGFFFVSQRFEHCIGMTMKGRLKDLSAVSYRLCIVVIALLHS